MTDWSEAVELAQAFGPDLAAKLLRPEYPADMAAASCSCEPPRASCTCEPVPVCGAHRLLARYEELYAHLQEMHTRRRQDRAARRPEQ